MAYNGCNAFFVAFFWTFRFFILRAYVVHKYLDPVSREVAEFFYPHSVVVDMVIGSIWFIAGILWTYQYKNILKTIIGEKIIVNWKCDHSIHWKKCSPAKTK